MRWRACQMQKGMLRMVLLGIGMVFALIGES
jgi:hypothetical protein